MGRQQFQLDHQQPGQLAAIVWGSHECRDHQDRPFYLSHNIALRPPPHLLSSLCFAFALLLPEYISDVQNKIVEHNKIESGCKKIVKALQIPISTFGVIIKRF